MRVATALDGRRLRDELLAELRARLEAAGCPPVTLALVTVGADSSGRWAIRAKRRAAGAVGIDTVGVDLAATATQDEVESALSRLGTTVDAIFLQLPLPGHLDQERVVGCIPPERDIDGLSPLSPFVPAATIAAQRLLQRHRIDDAAAAGIDLTQPGGVGPVTIACLLEAAARAAGVGH